MSRGLVPVKVSACLLVMVAVVCSLWGLGRVVGDASEMVFTVTRDV